MKIALVGAELEESLAIRYLWGALHAEGHEVVFVPFNEPEGTEAAAAALAASGARLAGMSMVFTRRAREFTSLATRARELGFAGHITAGGHFAAFNAPALLGEVPALDSVVVGEGEEILCALARHLATPDRVAGLVWRDAEGRVVDNPPSRNPRDLDARPWPVRRRPHDSYLGLPIVNMLASRGCSHACHFCSISAWHRMCGGPRLRLRAPEAVAEEMGALYADGVRVFNFHDDNFLLPSRRATLDRLDRLTSALEREGVGRMAFAIKARPDEVEHDLFRRLVSMGLFRVFLGVEAGSEESLLQLGRGQVLADNERALAIVNELGIHACFNLLLWNPDSTVADVRCNVDFLRAHTANPMNFCRTEIYAGTPLESRLRDSNRLEGDYWGWDYRMEDPLAELSFQVAYAVFEERNYGETSLHHSAMRLDYEHQLLAHFFGTEPALQQRVKGFVHEVNADTAAHLTRIFDALTAGEDPARVARTVGERVAARDRELDALAARILREVQAAAPGPRRGTQAVWACRAAAASLAATLSIGGPGCSGDNDEGMHYSEQVAVPTQPVGPTGAQLTPLPQPDPELAEGRPEAIRPAFDAQALALLGEEIAPAREVGVDLEIDRSGAVKSVALRVDGLADPVRERILAQLRAMRFEGATVVGRRYSFTVPAVQIAAAAPPPPPTHMHERAPRPPTMHSEMAPLPPTHPFERIANPPNPPTHPREMAPPAMRRPVMPHPAEMAPKPPGKPRK